MAKDPSSEVVIIRSWPKMIFMWPTAILALAAALVTAMAPEWKNIIGGSFLLCFALNLVVLTFDFPRSTSLTVFIAVVAVVLILVLLNQNFGIIAPLQKWLGSLEVNATPGFYYCVLTSIGVLFLGMIVVTRFDYWELSSNELIHHSGLLGDVERFSTAGLKLNAEINDVFEYLLSGAGRMILNVPGNVRPVVLDNVLRISFISQAANKMLSHRVVEIAKESTNGVSAEYE